MTTKAPQIFDVLCIGAGPGGLTAAHLLAKKQKSVLVLEADPKSVGGISRTAESDGYRFDIGGHRFFTKSPQVSAFWKEILPTEMLRRKRKSRILYRGRFFSYPLRPFEALINLGIFEAVRCALSYGTAKALPIRNPKSFEAWVRNQFGRRLFEIFFRTYTEKVWGMPCGEISADWAAQRIKGLSLGKAVMTAVLKSFKRSSGASVKTLIEEFDYPRLGPGLMWTTVKERVQENGGEVRLGCHVKRVRKEGDGLWKVTYTTTAGDSVTVQAREVISSAPIRELATALDPKPRFATTAMDLRYRDFLTVVIIAHDRGTFDDNWLYVHEPGVKVGRIQNFKEWSPDMVPDLTTVSLGMEYFCFESDDLWSMSDSDLVALAGHELEKLKLVNSKDIIRGVVVRQPKAYPVYDDQYRGIVDAVRTEIEQSYAGLHLVGRNGMHKYNNQDHSMMTAMLTVENILAGRKVFDTWLVNEDAEYHEEEALPAKSSGATGLRLVPTRLQEPETPARKRRQPIVSELSRRRKLRQLVTRLDGKKRILEVGSGDGWFADHLRELGHTVVTLDRSVQADFRGDILDWEKLGLEAGSFDVVVAMELIEHVDCLDTLVLLAKPSGLIYLSSPHPRWDWMMKILESLRLLQRRTSPHINLTDFARIPLEAVLRSRPLGIHQVAIFRTPNTTPPRSQRRRVGG